MQNPGIQLEEVIYEITSYCPNNCVYCGSKESMAKTPESDEMQIYKSVRIMKSIMTASPSRVVISGGNPLHVKQLIHEEVVSIAKKGGATISIIVNAKDLLNSNLHVKSTLALYDRIGISVNTIEELEAAKTFLLSRESFKKKAVIITNVNIRNVFLLDDIVSTLIIPSGCTWQLQLTMYNNNSDEKIQGKSLEYFVERLRTYVDANIPMLFGDNMLSHTPCTAGISTCGVTADGELISCISKRTWCNPPTIYGFLLGKESPDVAALWRISFHEERYHEHMSCKDNCGNIDILELLKQNSSKKPIRRPAKQDETPRPPNTGRPTLADFERMIEEAEHLTEGFVPQTIMVYGVGSPNSSSYTTANGRIYSTAMPEIMSVQEDYTTALIPARDGNQS